MMAHTGFWPIFLSIMELQVVLSVTENLRSKPSDEHFPAGRTRIEPVGVIIVVSECSITLLLPSTIHHQVVTRALSNKVLSSLLVVDM